MDKPFGCKNYGSMGHLPNSRMGPGDHSITEGQARIACERKRDKHDRVIVTEKLDGSNVGVGKLNSQIIPLSRAGYRAETSRFELHHWFADFVMSQQGRFAFLQEGERLIGEWLLQAHGTRYNLPHEPFVVFDLMVGSVRCPYDEFVERTKGFILPHVIEPFEPISVEEAMGRLGEFGFHGALEEIEGAVWRVERFGKVDFLTKFVRPDKVDGKYLPEVSGGKAVWNTLT